MRPWIKRLSRSPGLVAMLVGGVLLAALNFLQPDTSLQLVEESGVLRVCVPTSFPPLVTGDSIKPGFDVEVLQEIARRLKLRLALNVVPAMGNGYNPRNWSITRSACEVVAGGVTTSDTTRSFLETIPIGVENEWVLIGKPGDALGSGRKVGVFPGYSGLDRSKLSAYLRAQGAQITLASSADDLASGLKAGSYDLAITGVLEARPVTTAEPAYAVTPLPEDLGRYDFGIGLWKGDLTLKREFAEEYAALDAAGFIAGLRERYGLLPAGQLDTEAKPGGGAA